MSHPMTRFGLLVAALTAAFLCVSIVLTPAFAGDTVIATVVAHDRLAHRVVLSDKSVVTYDASKTVIDGALKAGDRVRITFAGPEGEMSTILAVRKVD